MYRDLLVDVLTPAGPALSRDPDDWYPRLMQVLADELARYDAFVRDLADELDPQTTAALLPEWEAMVGLPDPCTGQLPTLEARRQALLQRLTKRGRLTAGFVKAAAAAMGFAVDAIVRHDAFVAGTSEVGEELADQDAQFVFDVETPDAQVFEAEVAGFAVGEPLGFIGNSQLECLLERIRPAHTLHRVVLGG